MGALCTRSGWVRWLNFIFVAGSTWLWFIRLKRTKQPHHVTRTVSQVKTHVILRTDITKIHTPLKSTIPYPIIIFLTAIQEYLRLVVFGSERNFGAVFRPTLTFPRGTILDTHTTVHASNYHYQSTSKKIRCTPTILNVDTCLRSCSML